MGNHCDIIIIHVTKYWQNASWKKISKHAWTVCRFRGNCEENVLNSLSYPHYQHKVINIESGAYGVEYHDARYYFVQLVDSSPPSAAALVRVMACRLFGAKLLPEPMLAYCQWDSWEQNFSEIRIRILLFSFKKMHLKLSFAKNTWLLAGIFMYGTE